jgi:glycosyltransferase involved in cell wall biosynthesis
MLRVLQLGPLPPPWGGVQTNLDGIHQLLLRRGHKAAGLNITRHRRPDSPLAFFPSSAAQVMRLLWTLPYDIFHLHLGGELTARLLALCVAVSAVPGKRSVLSFHSGGFPSSSAGKRAAYWTLPGAILRRFDRVITVNQQLLDVFRRYGVAPDRCRFIPPYWVPDRAPALSEGPLPDFFARHSPVLLSVGLLEPEYDLPRQLEAFEILRRGQPGAGLVWIGSGALTASLRASIAASPEGSHVLLLGDVARPQTLAAIAQADLLWRTTLYDGDAVSVREALHFGTRVLATDNGMRPPGVHLTPIADTAALVSRTQAALASPRPAPHPQDGEANLSAVLSLYEEIAPPARGARS